MNLGSVIILLVSLAVLFGCCSDPTSTSDEHLTKLWELPLESLIATSFIATDNFLIFKTSDNTGKLYKVSKDGKSVRSASTGGCTRGTPILQSSVIYSNNCSSLYALKESDLSIIWSVTDFGFIPMPVADEKYVYATDRNVLRALDKSDGHTVWYTPKVGKNSANPVISGDTLYFVTWQLFADGFLYAFNTTDTTILYQRRIPYDSSKSQEGGSEAGVEIWNDRIFVAGSNRIFYCFNKTTGDSIWAFEADAPMDATPRVSDGIVYFGTLNRTCYALDASTGALKWTYRGVGSIILEPSFYQNYVMFKSLGDLLILDKQSGKEVLKMGSSEFSYDNAYWDVDGKIYAGGYRGSDQQTMLIAYQFR